MKHNWEYKRLGEVCEKGSSNLMQKNLEILEDGFPVFGASGCLGKIGFYQQEKPYVGIVKDGSGVGRCKLYPAKSSLLGTMQYIIANENVTNAYLCYLLQSLNLSKYVNGAAIPHIYFRDYQNERVPIPPLEVQERIVEELDKINEVMDDCRELISNLDSLAQSLFYDTFGDPISNPKGWEVKKIKEIGDVITGSTPNTKVKEFYDSRDVCFVKPGDVGNEISYIHQTKDYISNLAFESCCRKLTVGSVVITCIGIIGRVGILKVAANCNQQINAITPFKVINNVYLAYTLRAFSDIFTEAANGPVVKILNKTSFSNFYLPVPPLALQEEFAERIEAIEAVKANVQKQLTEMQTLLASRVDYWFN